MSRSSRLDIRAHGISSSRNSAIHSSVVLSMQTRAGKLVERDHVVAPRRDAAKARIVANFRLADRRPEFAPVPLGIGHHAQIAVLGLVRPAPGAGDARIAERSQRRHEIVAEQMLGEHERHQLLEHRDFDELAAAGFLARQQGDRNGVGDRERGDLVGQDGRRVARLAADRHQGGDAGLALDDVVIGRLAAIGTAVAVAVQRRINQARIARAHRLMREAELFDLLRPHRMHENVGARRSAATARRRPRAS